MEKHGSRHSWISKQVGIGHLDVFDKIPVTLINKRNGKSKRQGANVSLKRIPAFGVTILKGGVSSPVVHPSTKAIGDFGPVCLFSTERKNQHNSSN